MKKMLITLSLLWCALGASAQQDAPLAVAKGSVAPAFTAKDTLGVKHALKDYQGQYLVLDFWASWCGDCRREIPALISLERAYRGQQIDGKPLTWLSVSFDHERQAWREALRRYQMPWMQISNNVKWKSDPISKKYGLRWIPTFLLIDPQGKVVDTATTAEGLATILARLTGDVVLPAPNKQEPSTPLVQTLAERHSVRNFQPTPLNAQQLSNLCWAACGLSRDAQHRTAPTARNMQEIRLYVFTAEAVYEYDAHANLLRHKATGDHRALMAGRPGGFLQTFAQQAPVSLLMVIDYDRFGSRDLHAQQMGCVDAGIVSQNINLYCQSVGLATVPRATHDTEGLRKLLGLTAQQLPIMNNPVGWEKK